jgi:RimJ/RimL family protein N-acetyltransferase
MLQLETDRLLLRAPVREDAVALAPMYADPEVMRYVGDGRTLTRAETDRSVRRTIERWEADGFGLFTTVRKEDEAVIGRVGLLVWNTDTWEPTTRPRRPARCATTRSASSAPTG